MSKLADDSLEAFSPAWSPASHELTFSDHAMNGESDLFVMQANAWA